MSQSTAASSEEKDPVRGITAISVRGYKSLYEECSIQIRPLTILAGANSSGKSSIIQPLLLLKQTLEATYDPGALLLNGPHVRFNLAEQLFSQVSGKQRQDRLNIKIEIDGDTSLDTTFGKSPLTGMEITEVTGEQPERTFTLMPKMERQDIIAFLSNIYGQKYGLVEIIQSGKGEISENLEWNILRERCFLNIICKSMTKLMPEREMLIPMFLYDSHTFTAAFENSIRQVIHVPGLRGNPERTYKITAIGSAFPGTFENYVASIVNHWQNNKDKRLRDLISALETLGLTGQVEARQVDDVQVELRVGRLPASGDAKDMVNIADVGLGVSQVLPVLVALLVAEPGQLVYLEQPEIHLHPRAQAALAQILADAANRGVRVVVETHSDLLLTRIQALVASERISPVTIELHWFQQREDGVTEVKSAELDNAGAFGDWPVDFGEVALEEESRYLDAAESRLLKS